MDKIITLDMDNQIINQQVNGFKPTKIIIDEVDEKGLEEAAKSLFPTSDLSHEKLLSCLYFIFDAFERASLQFFLIRQTAKDAMQGIFSQLTGDHIDIGIRKLEWDNDQKDILFTYLDQEHVEIIKEEPTFIEFKWQDIPFTLHIYEDNPCLTALIPLVFQNEEWMIPNRFDIFEKEYDK